MHVVQSNEIEKKSGRGKKFRRGSPGTRGRGLSNGALKRTTPAPRNAPSARTNSDYPSLPPPPPHTRAHTHTHTHGDGWMDGRNYF
ncbi:hypothetical protein QE152_g19150 [Popillia japonica]|uniref:Uncharacterized protein n=1 Tax=Popillia japonica TaxID=7064 RepID=A0AAW1L2E5_POPJA